MSMKINMSKNHQAQFNKYFASNGIHYQPAFGILFGLNAGVMLSQLLYWHGSGAKKPWTYKTIGDMRSETGLTLTQQNTAIKRLVGHGILEVKNKGVPQTRHFKLSLERLHSILPSLKETYKLSYPNPPNYIAENTETITKITRKTTTKNTEIHDKKSYMNAKKQLLEKKDMRGGSSFG